MKTSLLLTLLVSLSYIGPIKAQTKTTSKDAQISAQNDDFRIDDGGGLDDGGLNDVESFNSPISVTNFSRISTAEGHVQFDYGDTVDDLDQEHSFGGMMSWDADVGVAFELDPEVETSAIVFGEAGADTQLNLKKKKYSDLNFLYGSLNVYGRSTSQVGTIVDDVSEFFPWPVVNGSTIYQITFRAQRDSLLRFTAEINSYNDADANELTPSLVHSTGNWSVHHLPANAAAVQIAGTFVEVLGGATPENWALTDRFVASNGNDADIQPITLEEGEEYRITVRGEGAFNYAGRANIPETSTLIESSVSFDFSIVPIE